MHGEEIAADGIKRRLRVSGLIGGDGDLALRAEAVRPEIVIFGGVHRSVEKSAVDARSEGVDALEAHRVGRRAEDGHLRIRRFAFAAPALGGALGGQRVRVAVVDEHAHPGKHQKREIHREEHDGPTVQFHTQFSVRRT